MEKLSCIYLQKDEAGSSILTFGLQGDFKVSADADSRVKSIPIPYGNGPKGYFDYSGNQPGLSYSQQALVSVPAFGTQPRAFFYCNLLALLSGGNPFMISYKDGVGDVRHTESVFGGTSSDIYSFTACSIHHQYSWNLECYYQSSTYIKSDITALTTDFCTCYLPAQAHRYTPLAPSSGLFARYVGTKAYELKDHLGNVRATVSDCKIGGPLQANMVPELLSASNYYAFGMLMPGRIYQPESHRFGFNGQEKDDDINGSGNLNTAMYWEYDTRLGRRWNLDPMPNPFESNYSVLGNDPIWMVDRFGDKWKNEDDTKSKDNLIQEMSKKAEVAGSKVDGYIQKLDEAEKNGDTKGADKYENLAEEAINTRSEMLEGIKELNKMTDDQLITFTFNDLGQSDPSKDDVAKLSWSGNGWGNNDPSKERLITINHFSRTGNGYRTNGNKVHETLHAYDVLMQQMIPYLKGSTTDFNFGIGGNFKAEKESYLRQFYFDKGSMPGYIQDSKGINRSYLIGLGYKFQ